jgi:hypothetical protein
MGQIQFQAVSLTSSCWARTRKLGINDFGGAGLLFAPDMGSQPCFRRFVARLDPPAVEPQVVSL